MVYRIEASIWAFEMSYSGVCERLHSMARPGGFCGRKNRRIALLCTCEQEHGQAVVFHVLSGDLRSIINSYAFPSHSNILHAYLS